MAAQLYSFRAAQIQTSPEHLTQRTGEVGLEAEDGTQLLGKWHIQPIRERHQYLEGQRSTTERAPTLTQKHNHTKHRKTKHLKMESDKNKK